MSGPLGFCAETKNADIIYNMYADIKIRGILKTNRLRKPLSVMNV